MMNLEKYNQGIQRHFSNLVKFPGIGKKTKADEQTKILKSYDVLWFLLNNE